MSMFAKAKKRQTRPDMKVAPEEKIAAKVVEGSTSLGAPGDNVEAFLSKQRREKVKKMVESYAASYAKAKK